MTTSCDELATKPNPERPKKGGHPNRPAIQVDIEDCDQGRLAVMLDGEVLAVGHCGAVCLAARELIERGHDPAERLEAWRPNLLFFVGSLESFASIEDDNPIALTLALWAAIPK